MVRFEPVRGAARMRNGVVAGVGPGTTVDVAVDGGVLTGVPVYGGGAASVGGRVLLIEQDRGLLALLPGGGGIGQPDADARYVRKTGDIMTGPLSAATDAVVGGPHRRVIEWSTGAPRWDEVLYTAGAVGGPYDADLYFQAKKNDGSTQGNALVLRRATATAEVFKDPTAPLGIATKQLVETWAPRSIGGMWSGILTFAGGFANLPSIPVPNGQGGTWKAIATVQDLQTGGILLATALGHHQTEVRLRVYVLNNPAFAGAQSVAVNWTAVLA